MGLVTNQAGFSSVSAVLALTIVMTVLMGGTVDYILKGQETMRAGQLTSQAQEANEREAIAISRIFASLGGELVQADLFRIQEMLQTGFGQEGLVEALVLDTDNMIVAAKNSAQIGQSVQDIEWLALRAQNKEVVSRTPDQSGRPLVTVVEPMKDKGETVAWAKLTYSITSPAVTPLPPAERLKQTIKFVGPLAFVLLVCLLMVARWFGQNQQVSDEDDVSLSQGEDNRSSEVKRLRKVS
jgi:uncharacterized membrane protein affecting hemolysin expression